MRAVDVAKTLCKSAKKQYLDALDHGDQKISKVGIITPLRLAHFLAQIFHESGGLTIVEEDGHYTAKNLAHAWDAGNWHKYFASRDQLIAMADQCKLDGGKKLFSIVYSNRMGNGPPDTGDGWTYRGRGLLQTTGKEDYARFSKLCGVDFVHKPELFLDPDAALMPALLEWSQDHCNEKADHDDIVSITIAINGGKNGLDDRRVWLSKTKKILGVK